MKYTVNDTTSYGIYNGFSKFDTELKSIMEEEIFDLLGEDHFGFVEISNHVLEALNKDKSIKEAAMQYYRPYPIHDDWKEEIKELFTAMIKDKTAPGECDIPASKVRVWVHNYSQQCVKQYANDRIEECRALIKKAEAQKDIPSPEEAQRQMHVYNEAINQGGYGYVPYIVNSDEFERAKNTLHRMESLLSDSLDSRIQSASARAVESHPTSDVKPKAPDPDR